ncbi:MAG TPA: hypothetical protein VK464_09400 [Symbiobacteriaceae bacterium]|nr:hypothetical protein [Symbiobacteriaceae bacterium]
MKMRLALGAGAWALLAAAGAAWAGSAGRPLLQTVVTVDEWAVAVLLLPTVLLWVFGVVQRDELVRDGARKVVGTAWGIGAVAMVIFALDLATRAAFGLGWKPF